MISLFIFSFVAKILSLLDKHPSNHLDSCTKFSSPLPVVPGTRHKAQLLRINILPTVGRTSSPRYFMRVCPHKGQKLYLKEMDGEWFSKRGFIFQTQLHHFHSKTSLGFDCSIRFDVLPLIISDLLNFVSPVLTMSRYDFLPNQRNVLDLGFWIYNRVLNNEFTTIEYATRLIVTCMFLYVISHHISVCVTFEPWSIVYGLWQSWSCIDGNPEIWMLWMLGKVPLKQWSYDHPKSPGPIQKKIIKYWLVKNGIPLIIIGYVMNPQ